MRPARCRARQYLPVCTLIGLSPSAERSAAQPFTAFWQELLASSVCRMNIDSGTVGGYRRSRCSSVRDSVASSNSELAETPKSSTACVDPARSAIPFRCCPSCLRALRSILLILGQPTSINTTDCTFCTNPIQLKLLRYLLMQFSKSRASEERWIEKFVSIIRAFAFKS